MLFRRYLLTVLTNFVNILTVDDLTMAARATMKSMKCMTLGGARRLILVSLIGMALFAFLLPRKLLNFRLKELSAAGSIRRFGFRSYGRSFSETVLLYAKFNPAVTTERERIKTMLKATNYGKINIQEVLFSKKAVQEDSKSRLKKEWMLPFANREFEVHMPKLIQVAKEWLGDYGDFNPRIMQDLVKTVKRPLDRNAAYWAMMTGNNEDISNGSNSLDWERKYQSCAVIGNSGILLNGNYGEQIDNHEMVMRLNNAQVYEHAQHVGSKTTLSFLNSNIFITCSVNAECWCQPYGAGVPIVLYTCQAKHLLHVTICQSKHRSALILTNSLLDALSAAIVKWYSIMNFMQTTGRPMSDWDSVHLDPLFRYSSGMEAVVLALGICDSVDLYGFGKSPNAKHHYHSEQKMELTIHDFAAEYLFYDDLTHNRTIPFLSDAGIPIPPVRIFI